jgi:hypothetical protein
MKRSRRRLSKAVVVLGAGLVVSSSSASAFVENGCMTEMQEWNESFNSLWHGGSFAPHDYHQLCDAASPHECIWEEATETAERYQNEYHGSWVFGTYGNHGHEEQPGGDCTA